MRRARPLLEALIALHPQTGRERLLALVIAGQVKVDDEVVREPRRPIGVDALISIQQQDAYVSRGGLKLDAALRGLALSVTQSVALDAGASTGGFSDCLLRRGAKQVYAVDVGYNQLAYRLRIDPRVVVMERRRITDVTPAELSPPPDIAVADLSFRSLCGVAGHLLQLVRGWALCLVKPQFELRNPGADFRGVVGPEQHATLLQRVANDLEREGAYLHGCCPSPVPGRRGNREFFFLLRDTPARLAGAEILQMALPDVQDPSARSESRDNGPPT